MRCLMLVLADYDSSGALSAHDIISSVRLGRLSLLGHSSDIRLCRAMSMS